MAHEEIIGWQSENAREGVDTRKKDVTGTGAVKVIPELGVPAVERGNTGEVGRVQVFVVEHSDGSVSVSYLPVPVEMPKVDTRSTEEIMKDLMRLANKAERLVRRQEELVEMAQVSQRELREHDLFSGSRTREIDAMVAKTKKKKLSYRNVGAGQVVVDGVAMEVPLV